MGRQRHWDHARHVGQVPQGFWGKWDSSVQCIYHTRISDREIILDEKHSAMAQNETNSAQLDC